MSSSSPAAPTDQTSGFKRGVPLPAGTLAVGLGLLISGICSYAFIAVSNRALGTADRGAMKLLWFGTFALAPGFFLPLEQEVGRALSHRRARGEGGLPLIRRAATLGAILIGFILLAIVVISPLLIDRVFEGEYMLLVGLAIGVAGFGATHFTRGILAGNDRFQMYGATLALDGLLRIAACVVLWWAGVKSVGAFGLLIGLPALVAISLVVKHRHALLIPGPPAPRAEVTSNLGWLLLGSVPSAFLVNAGPLSATLLGKNTDKAVLSAFSSAVLVSRVPLFMFQAVQAALLPKLAALAAAGEFGQFRSGFRRLIQLVIGVGVIGTIGAALLGPTVLRRAFAENLDATHLAMLAVASSVYMLAMALAQALIALHAHAHVGIGWLVGFIAFLLALAIPNELLTRVETALVVGATVALVIFAWSLRRSLAHGGTLDADSIREALHDLPLEP